MTGPDLEAKLRDALGRKGSASSDFDLNRDVTLPTERVLTAAAVLIGIHAGTGSVILTTRSARLKHHPGQIAFPGGRKDFSDETLAAAALREAHEEIGLPQTHVRILGEMPAHETVTGYVVTPIVALIERDFTPIPEAGEVSEVFEVPLSHLTQTENFRIESRFWQGRRRYYYTVPYGPYYIWGATARILRALAERMQP